MARLTKENGDSTDQIAAICEFLNPLNIELASWPTPDSLRVQSLLNTESLLESQKNELLSLLDYRFDEQKRIYGYQSRDLVVLYPEMPGLDDLLKKFDRCHRHDDDEVRYIVDGCGIFGFVMPTGEQVKLRVDAQEYIRVPAHTEHWFVLDSSRRVKAVRYFTNSEGWVANYTGTMTRV